MAETTTRSPEIVRREIAHERTELARAVEQLRTDLGGTFDLRRKVGSRAAVIAPAAFATAFVVSGGIGATMRLLARRLPQRWSREEEWYNFRTNPRDDVHVLLSVDESTYDPRGYSVPGGSPPMGDHPISWCQPYDGGRAFYTALGHKGVYWEEPLLLSHVLGGIEMAAGVKQFDCGEEDD